MSVALLSIRLLLAACLAVVAVPSPAAAQESAGWSTVSQSPTLTVSQRPRKGSDLLEFKAIGRIAAPPEVVLRVLNDVPSYPSFMPYVVEARILSEDAKSRVTYQRISPPLISDRDYTVRVKFETRRTPDGTCYCNRWQAANDLGPAPKKGVTRVNVTEGYWLLEPADGGSATQATYFLFSDSGGALPAGLLNTGSRTAIPKLFEAIRKQVRLEKYLRPK